MKKVLKIIISLVLVLIIIFTSGIFYLTRGLKDGINLSLNGINLANLNDGTYIGEYKSGRWSNTIDILVKNHRIAEIKIKDDVEFAVHDVSDKLFEEVIKNQSTTVDTVSGATVTSKAYLMSIENALNK